MIAQNPDAHGLVIVLAGEKERAAARVEHAALLEKLCSLHEPWCLGTAKP
jgi:hypothetical protein